MVSARILTQAYTTVVWSAVFSFTALPLELVPNKKLVALPQKLFFGLARVGKILDRKDTFMSHLLKIGMKNAPVSTGDCLIY